MGTPTNQPLTHASVGEIPIVTISPVCESNNVVWGDKRTRLVIGCIKRVPLLWEWRGRACQYQQIP